MLRLVLCPRTHGVPRKNTHLLSNWILARFALSAVKKMKDRLMQRCKNSLRDHWYNLQGKKKINLQQSRELWQKREHMDLMSWSLCLMLCFETVSNQMFWPICSNTISFMYLAPWWGSIRVDSPEIGTATAGTTSRDWRGPSKWIEAREAFSRCKTRQVGRVRNDTYQCEQTTMQEVSEFPHKQVLMLIHTVRFGTTVHFSSDHFLFASSFNCLSLFTSKQACRVNAEA